jgi:hypothetical protein
MLIAQTLGPRAFALTECCSNPRTQSSTVLGASPSSVATWPVKTQVWAALPVYVPVAIVKKQLALNLSLHRILQILSVTVFEKTPILEGFATSATSLLTLNPVSS